MNNSQAILLQILAITGSSTGKEQDVDDFLTLIQMQVITDLIGSLPPEKHDQIIDLFLTLPNAPQKAEKILAPYYTREHMRKMLKNATKKAIVERFVEPHRERLTPSQQKRILTLLEKLTC